MMKAEITYQEGLAAFRAINDSPEGEEALNRVKEYVKQERTAGRDPWPEWEKTYETK